MDRRLVALVALIGCGAEYELATTIDINPEEITECTFDPVEGSDELSAYSCNPVFTTSGEDWASTTGSIAFLEVPVMGHPFYQVWYVGWPEGGGTGDADIGTAVSSNGTDWEPHTANPGWPSLDKDAWDGGSLQQIKVAWDAEEAAYRMLYGGISRGEDFFGVGMAASRDGLTWETMPGNPVLSLSASYAGVDLAWPVSLDIQDGEHRALFAGAGGPDRQDLYSMETRNSDRWDTEAPELVLKAGKVGDWDDEGFLDAAIVELDGVHWLFYVGFGEWIEDGDVRWSTNSFLGLARSDDGGDTWERVGDGLLPLNNTNAGEVSSVQARAVGTRIHVWVGDHYRGDVDDTAVGLFLFEPGGRE